MFRLSNLLDSKLRYNQNFFYLFNCRLGLSRGYTRKVLQGFRRLWLTGRILPGWCAPEPGHQGPDRPSKNHEWHTEQSRLLHLPCNLIHNEPRVAAVFLVYFRFPYSLTETVSSYHGYTVYKVCETLSKSIYLKSRQGQDINSTWHDMYRFSQFKFMFDQSK